MSLVNQESIDNYNMSRPSSATCDDQAWKNPTSTFMTKTQHQPTVTIGDWAFLETYDRHVTWFVTVSFAERSGLRLI